MEESGLKKMETDDEEKALEGLLDAFGFAFSLREIAHAYCKAGRNPDLAAQILYVCQRRRNSNNLKSSALDGESRQLNQKGHSVYVGSISGAITEDYINSLLAKGYYLAPLLSKVDLKVRPWPQPKALTDDFMVNGIEEYLLNVLENECQMDRGTIQEVLDCCGCGKKKAFFKSARRSDLVEEDNYKVLRKAVKEYRAATKEYYKAAVEAYAKGNHTKADKLTEQGHFFHGKAREADEESAQEILRIRDAETREIFSLDLGGHDAKEAVSLLKFHLSRLAGISSLRYLKVFMGKTSRGDITQTAPKRAILKLLEKESIKWTEEKNDETILICVDKIIRKNLSFGNKYRLANL